MDHKDIKNLAAIMREMGLTSIEYQNGAESVKLARPAEIASASKDESNTARVEWQSEETPLSNSFTVKSPMVGVFYSAPAADAGPYVSIGDTILVGDVLCVIEAMKIMNEITAERDGVITEVFAENKQIVEFGQPLFRIGTAESRREHDAHV